MLHFISIISLTYCRKLLCLQNEVSLLFRGSAQLIFVQIVLSKEHEQILAKVILPEQ